MAERASRSAPPFGSVLRAVRRSFGSIVRINRRRFLRRAARRFDVLRESGDLLATKLVLSSGKWEMAQSREFTSKLGAEVGMRDRDERLATLA